MHRIKKIKYNSPEYQKVLFLRDKILRKPLGLSLFDEDLSQDKDQLIYGVFSRERLVACLQLVPMENNIYKLRQMVVDTTFQRKGLGRKLIDFVERDLSKKQAKEIVLHARKSAVGFYKKLGYEISSEEFIEVGIPHFKMHKYL